MHWRLWPLLWLCAFALAEQAMASDDKDEDEDDNDGPWEVEVPERLRHQGYSLRIDDDLISLDANKVKIESGRRRQDVQLLKDGRIQSSDIVWVDRYVMRGLEPRRWRVGLGLGGATINGEAFRDLLQDSFLEEFSVSGAYQPGALGIELQVGSQTSEQSHSHDIDSTYESHQTGINAIYELSPFQRGSSFARRLTTVWHAGAFSATHSLKIGDGVVTLKDKDATLGAMVGADLLYNINNFWVGVKTALSYQEIEFKNFGFKTQAIERHLLFGGDYAF